MQPIKELGRTAKTVLIYLLTQSQPDADGIHVFTTNQLMEVTGVARGNTLLAVKQLVDKGWLEIVRDGRRSWKDGFTASARLLCGPAISGPKAPPYDYAYCGTPIGRGHA